MSPADEIAELIEGLYVTYNPRGSGANLDLLMRQYGKALSGASVDIIRKACEYWQYERESKRFPYPNEFADAIKVCTRRGEKSPENEPWRPIDQAEYDALQLRAKIRHCEILEHHYAGLAGPMWWKGKGDGPVNPERFAKYTPIAEKCRAEAVRLREVLAMAKCKEASSLQSVVKSAAVKLPFEV